jgi:hypothetical protein
LRHRESFHVKALGLLEEEGWLGGARLAKCVSDNISNNAAINLQPIPKDFKMQLHHFEKSVKEVVAL